MNAPVVDFVPPAWRALRARRRRVQRWLASITFYGGALAAAAAAFGISAPPSSDDRAIHLARVDEQLAALRTSEQSITANITLIQRAIEIDRTVSAHPDWSVAIVLIAQAAGEDLVLERIVVPPARADGLRRITITGFATTQPAVPAFVARLESTGLYATVELVEARRQPFRSTVGVAFQIDAEIGPAPGPGPAGAVTP